MSPDFGGRGIAGSIIAAERQRTRADVALRKHAVPTWSIASEAHGELGVARAELRLAASDADIAAMPAQGDARGALFLASERIRRALKLTDRAFRVLEADSSEQDDGSDAGHAARRHGIKTEGAR